MLLSTKIGIILGGHLLIIFLAISAETITVTVSGQPTGTVIVCLAALWVWHTVARLILPETREDS